MEGTPFGRYLLIEQLGQGGMGEVWRAHDTELDRTVAIKTLLPHFAKDPKFEERFRREARAAARLDDPHVVPIYDVGQIDERLYVSMRLVEGQDLQTLLGAGALAPARAVALTAQIAQALHAAHKVGLVHRDIKPSNILVAEHDFAYLIDFGIARAAGDNTLTSTGTTIGTWSYMSPERFSTGVAEPSSDIYALACVLYQCLTGQLPFPSVALEQIAVAHMTAPPPRPSAQRPDIPAEMDAVIARGMAKQPHERYDTASELASAAHRALAAPPTSRWASASTRTAPPANDRRTVTPPPARPADASHVSTPTPRPAPRPSQVQPREPTRLVSTPPLSANSPPQPPTPAPNISVGRFAYCLSGVVLITLALAADSTWMFGDSPPVGVLMLFAIPIAIPGIVLLVLGRGRESAEKTILGLALVSLGLWIVVVRAVFAMSSAAVFSVPAVVGMLLFLIPMYRWPTSALTRASRHIGTGVLALALISGFLPPPFSGPHATGYTVIDAAIGLILLFAGNLARRWAAGELTREPPAPHDGRFRSVLGGAVLVAIAVAWLLVPRRYIWDLTFDRSRHDRSSYYSHASWYHDYTAAYLASLQWLLHLAVIPGIALLVLGRRRTRPDDTIAGCALVALALGSAIFGSLTTGAFPYLGLIPAFVGVILTFIPLHREPTTTLGRRCIVYGAGILVFTLLALFCSWRFSEPRIGAIPVAAAIGLALIVNGVVVRRNSAVAQPSSHIT